MNIEIIKNDTKIASVEDWYKAAPPKDPAKQWKDGRSAKELARFATDPFFKEFIKKILEKTCIKEQDFECEPEATTSFGKGWGRGGPRNHDLLMIGENTLIGIEAKVSELFGVTIKQEKENVKDTKRIEKCLDFFFHYNSGKNNKDELYYQLFTATIGSIKAAQKLKKKIDNVIVLFLVFKGNVAKEKNYNDNVLKNNEAFNKFCEFICINKEGGNTILGDINCWIIKEEVEIKDTRNYEIE